MARQQVDIGVEGNDGTGDSIRESFRKVNENFQELYAVFGIGGQISFTDLSDTPDTYEGNENKVPAVRSNGSGIDLLELASDNALNGTVDTIGFDFSVDGKLIVRQLVSKLSNDPAPLLSGPLNAASQPIANITVSQGAIDTFNAVYNTDFGIDALVINKGYADRNYQKKEVPGKGIRLDDEPVSTSQYTLTADEQEINGVGTGNSVITQGYLLITGHGLEQDSNGTPFIFESTGTDPLPVVSGQVYYIRVQDANRIGLYETENNAVENISRLLLSGGSGLFTITEQSYDPSLEGNWLSNVALPRKSVVRRQGDTMTGILNLSDHPGELSGFGLPNGPDDLQAATKLYVDNASSTSRVNLFVSTGGDDRQTNTPSGLEGRNPSYAFRTVNAAARRAEELIESSPYEPGPYVQTMTFNSGEGKGTVVFSGVNASLGRQNARELIIRNKEFIQKEVTAYIDDLYTDFSYNREICQRDIGLILESVTLDSLLGDNANYLSRWAGIRYYSNPSAKKAIGSQRQQTVAGIVYAKNLIENYILTNTAAPTLQSRVPQFIDITIVPDVNAENVISNKFDIVLDVIRDGVLDAPTIVDGTNRYRINVNNGNFGFIDQANPENTDIIPGKVVRGKNSKAIGRIIDYKYESGPRAVTIPSTDEIEIQLLEPILFEDGEELEYGNIVRNTQITINVESGIYEEDYPIRIPANVSINGDEFRRSIIRPKDRVSQSRYANVFFYRDREFDGLVLGRSDIEQIGSFTNVSANVTRAHAGPSALVYQVDDSQYTTNKLGQDAIFEVSVATNGSITVTVLDAGKNWQVGDFITIPDSRIGNTGAGDVIFSVTKVPNGKEYINPLTNNVDGYFGFHYLTNPDKLKNIGEGYSNIGKWENGALALIDNKEFIQEQVVQFMETTYPSIIGNYDVNKSKRDTGYIVDALVKDLRNGGNEFALEMQGEFFPGSLGTINQTACIAGMDHILTIVESIFDNTQPTIYDTTGGNLEYPLADLFNGSADPVDWESGKLYRVGNVIRTLTGTGYEYYQCNLEHVSGNFFNQLEIDSYWDLVIGPKETVENLLKTVTFGLKNPEDYNPPLRNDEMDVFLMNDATIVRNVTVQGHGGFMVVLDPEGQVLTKSPYIQTGSSFSRSQNKQVFSGGMFVDAFTGNSAVRVVEKVDGSPFRLRIQSLGSQEDPQGLFVRRPQTPSAFYIDGRRFQVNAITQYDPDFGTAEIILSPDSNDGLGFSGVTSSLSSGINLDAVGTFEFDKEKCRRDTRLIIDAASYDTVLGTNYNSVTAGLAYQRANASVVKQSQLTQTTNAILVARDESLALTDVAADTTATNRVTAAFNEVVDIITNGVTSTETSADPLTFNIPGVLPTANADDAYARLQNNRTWFGAQIVAWVNANIPPAGYNQAKCARDTRFVIDALTYDILYGGNSATLGAARAYFVGTEIDQLPVNQREKTADAWAYLASIIDDILQGTPVSNLTGNSEVLNLSGSNATITESNVAISLLEIIENVIRNGNINSLPETVIYPDITWATSALQSAFFDLQTNKTNITRIAVQSIPSPIDITLQTAGNRSMLGNDFTQVNDLGYGLVCTNGALSEMVSMFTYYCWTSYYSKNGSQIRSLTGSSCYGEYGLVAEGSDPNEIPDAIELGQDMVMSAKTFDADVILYLTGPVILETGDVVQQTGTSATGTVSASTGQLLGGSSGSIVIYLTNTVGAFDTTNELSVIGPITGDSTVTALGPNSVPQQVDSTGYGNNRENLFLHVYDMIEPPSNRSEFDLYHPLGDIFARYEVANVEVIDHIVGGYENVGTDIPYTFVPGPDATGLEAGALFRIKKTVTNGYEVEILNPGTDYGWGDSFVISGSLLGGADIVHDCTITVTEIDGGDSSTGDGIITQVSAAGTIFIEPTTPVYNGTLYKLNFSTSDAQFSSNGLLEDVVFGRYINYRRNQTHIFNDIARPDVLKIRPSTAVIFKENPEFVYRSISFLTSDSIGNELPDGIVQAGFDETYDYIRLIVNSAKAQETPLAGAGTTKGGTVGDRVIAVTATVDANEVFRLNNNIRTPEANRPTGWTVDSLVEAPIFTWNGKKHYVFNYRGVDETDTIVPVSEDNEYGIVDILEVGEEILYPASSLGLAAPVVLGNETITIRAGLKSGALGDVTVNISTCRATSHDFLDVGTGGFNQSNYPNVIFGLPREKDQAKEVEERTKGRVFYVSTDQDGIFRVGRFFSVDQGTGTVTFSANIALSDVDGLGFKRGVVITEFSTDTAMTDNASDTVPTESAVRGYVNRRLGYDVTGAPVANKLGPGALAPNGAVPMTGDLNAAGNTVTNLKVPATDSDAATKRYVDQSISDNNSISDFTDTEINNIAEGQLLVTTGYKKIFIRTSSINNGPFLPGQVFQGTTSLAQGQIVDILTDQITGINVVVLVYTPISGTVSLNEVVRVTGGAEGLVFEGPTDEWANGVANTASDIVIDTNRELTFAGSSITDRYTTLNLQIKSNSIVNSDVNASANIAQSKLNLNAATTRGNATGITQNDRGLASFDSGIFAATDGWITINNGALPLRKIERISNGTVLGNWSGDSLDGDIDAISFETVINIGKGLSDDDFLSGSELTSAVDPGFALIKTGEGVYGISNVTRTGEVNSIVKTRANGSIQVNSLILGGDSSYEVLALDTTTVVFKTPAQGEILRAVGNSGTSGNANPDVNIPGHVNINSTGVSRSVLQNQSNFNTKSALGVSWIYSSFIEAQGEKGSASTGVAIGANTGKTTQGQIGMIVANTATSSSVAPFIFSSTGVVPDLTDTYNIGSASLKYNTVYATLFSGTALEAYYADLAENYLADAVYEPGTVLIFGGDNEVTTTTTKEDHRVAGVVTTNPAYLMNSHLEGDYVVGVALQGRVPCKVIGRVEKGDIIVTSAIPGYGMVNNNPKPGTVIGKALAKKETTDKGIIEVVVGKH